MIKETGNIREMRKNPYCWGVERDYLKQIKQEFNNRKHYPYENSYLIEIIFGDKEYCVDLFSYLIIPYKPDNQFLKCLDDFYEKEGNGSVHIFVYPLSKVEFTYDYELPCLALE